MRKYFWSLFAISLAFFIPTARAQGFSPVVIEVLERADCAHCQAELDYLKMLSTQRTDIIIHTYDIDTPEGAKLFANVTTKANLPKATPITIVGSTVFQGFDTPATSGARIATLIDRNRTRVDQGFTAFLAHGSSADTVAGEGSSCDTLAGICKSVHDPVLVAIPFTDHTLDISSWTLPTLAAVIGFFDGFNPCATWVLVTFLVILMKMGSRRHMWGVAGSFLLAEGVMYYFILNVWLRVWDFIGMDRIVTPVVGIISIAGGLFFLYEWYKSLGTEMACRIMDMEDRSRIVKKIKELSSNKFTLATVTGIVFLAFSVNVIEFACSIGYPQTFTKILQENALGFWHTQTLMLIYIMFYMVDDVIVFTLALWGFDKMRVTQGFSRWSALLGGLIMLFLGYLLIAHPEVLRF